MVVSHILEDLYNLARSSGPPVVGIEVQKIKYRLPIHQKNTNYQKFLKL